jgi:hypothetical protein
MAGVAEVIAAAKIPSALTEVSKAVESFRLAEGSPMADALKAGSRSLATSSAFASLGRPEFQDLFKNVAAQGSSPIVRDAMKNFAAVKFPPDILGINNFKIAGLFDPAVVDQFRSLSKAHTSRIAAQLADINGQRTILSALGAVESAALVKNLVPDVEWIKAFGASGAVNALLADSVGGLPNLAAEIASTTARLSTISLPKGKWFENVDLGINSWSNLVRVMPPQPSPRQLGSLSLMGTGALAVAETGLILADNDFEVERSTPDHSSFWQVRLRSNLMELGSDLIFHLDGAWERVSRPGPDAASQAAHSLVELIDWTLRRAAPNKAVLDWHSDAGRPRDELDGNGRPSRALQVRYLVRDRINESEVAELHTRCLIDLMRHLQKRKHSEGDKDRQAVARLIPAVEAMLSFILLEDSGVQDGHFGDGR